MNSKMDNKMLVKDMIKSIENKELNVEDVCSHFGISDRTYQKKIGALGFKWESKACKYNFNGTDETVFDMAIGDVFKKGSINVVKKEVENDVQNASEEIASTVQDDVKKTTETNSNNASNNTSKRGRKKTSDNIDRLLAGKKAKKEYRGFYLDNDVLGIIDNVDSGIKSELVNECLRKVFKEKGLL